ncbi:hypothetical protein VNI00_014908 [Paramarasmius palmivorus]|uniref:Uncharacterized protein n=1 Tax=Paramarasmius palmivorus TaxID=297713 RepID=A0AAW0BPL5_9AGAR
MLLLYALARPIASSLSAASTNNSTSFDPITGDCIDIRSCRTTTDILWSCLSVIFICAWVAIHPNIAVPGTHSAVAVYQNVELMVVALLAPEFMILWAMRQREQAKKIREKFKSTCPLGFLHSAVADALPSEYKWGMSHGFFVIMGGFALYNGEEFCGYLWDRDRTSEIQYANERPFEGKAEGYFERIKAYYEKHQKLDNMDENDEKNPESSTPPVIHENPSATKPVEIEPLSPTPDPTIPLEYLVAKGYITLTEDEIKDNLSHSDVITKSIAVIQTIWFIVQVIARAVEGLAITELEIVTVGFAILNFGTYFLWWNKPLRVRHPVRVYWRQMEKSGAGETGEGKGGIWGTRWEGAGAIGKYIYATDLLFENEGPDNILLRLLLLPLWIPWHIFSVCFQILIDRDDSNLAIPISSRLDNDPLHLYITVYGIAALFGAIHCIPWVFQFPTHTEQLLWRISAVAVAVGPIAMGFLHGFNERLNNTTGWIRFIATIILLFLPLAYAVFRITLLVIAFTALRDLSPSAYQTVQWTTFIPHIG